MKTLFDEKNNVKVATILISVLLFVQLFILKVGVEDNGSLSYTLGKLNMYDVNSASGSGFYSSLFGINNGAFNFISGNYIYSIVRGVAAVLGFSTVTVYIPSAIYFLLFILGTYLLLKKIQVSYGWNNILTFCVFALILCDVGYISYMNTPYSYGIIVALMPIFIFSVLNLSDKCTYSSLIIELLCSVLIFNSNVVFSVVGVIYGVYSIRYIALKKDKLWRFLSLVCALIIIVSNIISIISFNSREALYNSCFYGALLSKTNSAVINLPQEYSKYIGVPSFETEAQNFINSDKFDEFKEKIGYGNIISFYLKNPKILIDSLKTTAMNGTVIKIDYLGNYPVGSSHYSKEQTKFWSLYSTVKRRLFPANLIIMIVVFIGAAKISLNFKKNYSKTEASKISCELLALSSLSALISLITSMIFFGQAEICLNLFVFNIITDVTVLFSIIGGTRMLFIKRTILATKYGVNQ